MDFITSPTKYLFFTGKGGVGKTSIACASAVTLADRGLRTLLVSTDPASNLDDVLNTRVTNTPAPVPGCHQLSAVNVDPERAARDYRERVIGPYRGVLPADAITHMEEQLSGSCTLEIAAFDEFTGLLTDPEVAAAYDHIVFDTAPTGHTIRLLALPAAWTGFLDTNTTGSSCLGPLSGLNAQRERYEASVAALGDALMTTLILVSRPEPSALREAQRSSGELSSLGLANQRLVINGVFESSAKGDLIADAMASRHAAAMDTIPDGVAALPRTLIPLKRHNLVGLEAVRSMLFDDQSSAPIDAATDVKLEPFDIPPLIDFIDEIEKQGRGAVMTMGKGGVGKTTIAAAIAVELARRDHEVHLVTTDPAAHLASAVGGEACNLTVSRIDPLVETEAYRAGVLASSAGELDAAGLALLEEDLRSPCTEEVAVFKAFSRVLDEAADQFVVIDTAPTGHTLLLLDATGSYHREMVRQSGKATASGGSGAPNGDLDGAGNGVPINTPLMKLQDPSFTSVLIVTLPENTPILEASRLQSDLRRANIEPRAWIINASLSAANTTDPLLKARAATERSLIEHVQTSCATSTYAIPWQPEPPVGMNALHSLIGVSTASRARDSA